MNEEKIYKQEISFIDIVVRVLRSWKKALLFSALGAIILGGYILLTTVNPQPVLVMTTSQIMEAEKRIVDIDTLLTYNEEATEKYETDIENLESALETNERELTIKESEIERIKLRNEKLQALEEIYQTTVDATLAANIVDENFASDVMNLTVKLADAQYAVFENESRIVVLNKEIKEIEKTNETVIPKEIEEIEEKIAELEEEAKTLEKEADDLKESMTQVMFSEFSAMKVAIFAILGAVLGVMVLCGYIVVIMLYDNKVHSTSILEKGFELHVLGSISNDDNRKKKNLINKCINRLVGTQRNLSVEEEKAIIATKIKALSKTNKVMAIGTVDAEAIQSFVTSLNNTGYMNKFELIAAGNPMYSPETMNLLKEYELILVEKIDETNMKELVKLLRFLNKSEIAVLGVVEN